MAESNINKIKEKQAELKKELRAVQRDFTDFLNKNKNKTGEVVAENRRWYESQVQKAAKELNTFEQKNGLLEGRKEYRKKKATSSPRTDKMNRQIDYGLRKSGLSGQGGGGGGILTPDGNSSGLRGLPKGMTRKMNKGGFLAPASRPMKKGK